MPQEAKKFTKIDKDRYLIFMVTLASRDRRPAHWTLRGVALLCTTD
jgi:hypothetical protein